VCVGAIFSCWLKTVKIVWLLVAKLIWSDVDEVIPEWPHPLMYIIAIASVFRFTYCGDFVIHDNLVAPS
jgi:hypothetical protein